MPLDNVTVNNFELSDVLASVVNDHSLPFQHVASVIPEFTSAPIGLFPYSSVRIYVSPETQRLLPLTIPNSL